MGDGLVFLKQGAVITLLIDVVEVDSEDEREKTAIHTCSAKVKELQNVSTNQALNAPVKCLKRPLSVQRNVKPALKKSYEPHGPDCCPLKKI